MKLNLKNKVTLLGICLVIYICYSFAFSKTIEYYTRYKEDKKIIESAANSVAALQELLAKEKQLDTLLSQYSVNENQSTQNILLEQITMLAAKHNLKITDFREPHVITEQSSKTTSYLFSVEGGYNATLLLLNALENNITVGSIKHVSFIKKRNYKTNTDYLTCTIIVQKNENIKSLN